MATFELKMPKLGESIEQATITKWFVKEGDTIEEDQPLLEIATDKVDSEIPSPVEGKISKILFKEDDLVAVGTTIALISTDADSENVSTTVTQTAPESKAPAADKPMNAADDKEEKFYSPLVKSIAKQENISNQELDTIKGTGIGSRVCKADVMAYVNKRNSGGIKEIPANPAPAPTPEVKAPQEPQHSAQPVPQSDGDTVIEMDRIRKIIADHMVTSKRTSPHVTAMVDVDMQNVADWRKKNKDAFEKRYGEKLTYMPFFIEATAKALRDFPAINAAVDGDKIIIRKHVNIGIAVALPSGNLIVPVIKNADTLNIAGLAKQLSTLANAARSNKLSPDDIQGGTFTITNFGSFKNLMGTPIISQPQVAILATGTIEKRPAVIETPYGDMIVARQKMYLSLSYDHRVVDGMLGGNFLKRIADYLESFDVNQSI